MRHCTMTHIVYNGTMNTRDNKQTAPGGYYHIYNRGNAKQDIFYNPEDYNFFLSRLKLNLFPIDDEQNRIIMLPADSFSLIGYCLMPNHYHLIVRQNKEISTSKLITKVCTSYSKHFNKKYGRVGHLFQDRFKQINIDDNEYLKWLICYIHQNPKVAGLSTTPLDYRWSSYNYYIKGKGDIVCENDIILSQFKNIDEFRKFTDESYKIIKEKKEIEHLLLD